MNFLFDIGRVLLDFDFESSLVKLLPEGIENPQERLRRLLERKDEFEAGRIEIDDYIEWALGVMESNATHEEFCHAWRNIFTPNEPMWQRVSQLVADDHRLILFSNVSGLHVPWIYEAYPRFECFHGAVMSFQTGFIKPQAEIYEHALREYELDPDQTLYIDDLPENVEAGRAAGLRAWQYDLKDHAAFEAWLDEALNAEVSYTS